jgi:diacylglycerol kinase family enzyme
VKLAFVVNERSGKGRARPLADSFERGIADIVDSIETAPIGTDGESNVHPAISSCDAVVVFGGDGTMHSIAPIAAAAEKPVYHVPLGTENLFAREFRMSRDVARLRAAIDAWSVVEVDYGRCNGLPFLIMCSVGPDSSVIHRLAAERVGAISRSTYAPHVVRETLRPTIPTLDVEADGRLIVDGRRGIVIVANSRQYALRMDPARMASMTDGLLDVVFLPCTNSLKILTWGVRAFLRSIRDGSNAVHTRAESVQIHSGDTPAPVQVDGEAPGSGERVGDHPAAWTPLRIDIVKHALPVLAPPRPGRPR